MLFDFQMFLFDTNFTLSEWSNFSKFREDNYVKWFSGIKFHEFWEWIVSQKFLREWISAELSKTREICEIYFPWK